MYKKVVLVSLPKQDFLRPPGALPILASICELNNIDYSVHDFNLWLKKNTEFTSWQQINDNWDNSFAFLNRDTVWYQLFLKNMSQYITDLLKQQPDLISISIFSDSGCFPAFEFIKDLNSRPNRDQFKIVIGGTGIRGKIKELSFNDFCTFLLNDKKIDYFIFGEGEVTFSKLLQGIVDFPGINNFNAEQIEDLDSLPLPSYKKINPYDYEYILHPELIITGSRGCVRKCTYCDVAKYWPKFRYRSGQSIADEMWHYYKTLGITNFEFSDSLMNGSMKQFRAMNKAIIKYKKLDNNFHPHYKGQFICRTKSSMSTVDYAEMKEAGCDYVYVGLESFSDPVRYAMDKKFTTEDFEFHLKMCGRYGIKNSLLMIVGYPTETIEDHMLNLASLEKYQMYSQAGIIALIVFGYTGNILPDTPLYHQISELQVVNEFEDAQEFSTYNWVSLKNPTLNLKERIRRWVELTETASKLGYSMPRNKHYINSFINLLSEASTKRKVINLLKTG